MIITVFAFFKPATFATLVIHFPLSISASYPWGADASLSDMHIITALCALLSNVFFLAAILDPLFGHALFVNCEPVASMALYACLLAIGGQGLSNTSLQLLSTIASTLFSPELVRTAS